MSEQSRENLIWMDLEMTGLDVDKEVIIEIATLITDGDLNLVEEGPCIAIHQNDDILERMDDWNQTHHSASGLIERVKSSKIELAEAENMTLEFIKKHCPAKHSPLCGNSVGQDRKFLEKYMRNLSDYLHYRNIDVTSVKEVVNRWYPKGPKLPRKSEAHQALIDIRESLRELTFYRKHFFIDGELSEGKPADAKSTES
ncbi:MAG: oligoribonuclease [Nitrospinales bacterium]